MAPASPTGFVASIAVRVSFGFQGATAKCAVCHGDEGDGKGPAGLALPLRPADMRNRAAVAEMRDNFWFWRVSEGGLVEPFK
ncbi:MAG TPA: hypothetical protein VNP04_26760, partial [Alphaproteobacteria bacterium]|nr:hypothetical protein [Alphaproteobacteria bacterium]